MPLPQKLLPLDFINANLDLRCTNPDELMLFEFKMEEMVGSIILMAVSTQKFNQIDIIPKWRVVAVGDNVEKDIGIKKGDLVIVGRTAGRLRNVDEGIDIRLIHKSEILSKVIIEPMKDYENYIRKFFKEQK